jgi:ribonuclease P protein component
LAHWNFSQSQINKLISTEEFKKEERLNSKKLIDLLFSKGYQINIPPLKIFWYPTTTNAVYPAQAAVAVSRNRYPKATDRNRIKRLLRECYRKTKPGIYNFLLEKGKPCVFMIIYTGRNLPRYSYLKAKFDKFFEQFKLDYETSQ